MKLWFYYIEQFHLILVKFGLFEKATKFGKKIHLKFDLTEKPQIQFGRFFQILWLFQKIRTLKSVSEHLCGSHV